MLMYPIISKLLSKYYSFRLYLYIRKLPEQPNTMIWPRGYP